MRCLVYAVLLCLASNSAWAYSDASSFDKDPSVETSGGGGGLYFTGSPRQHGLRCQSCHIKGPTNVRLRLSALSAGEVSDLFQRGYVPGEQYEIEVEFQGDDLAPEAGCEGADDEPCNINAFALEILDDAGQPAGVLCPTAPTSGVMGCDACQVPRAQGTLVTSECSVLLADGFDATAFRWHNGARAYSFFWQAPMTDVGALSTYVSAVDGRGQETEEGEVTSFANDGVASVVVGLSSPTVLAEVPSSCRNFRGLSAGLWSLWLGLLFVRRRAAPRRSG